MRKTSRSSLSSSRTMRPLRIFAFVDLVDFAKRNANMRFNFAKHRMCACGESVIWSPFFSKLSRRFYVFLFTHMSAFSNRAIDIVVYFLLQHCRVIEKNLSGMVRNYIFNSPYLRAVCMQSVAKGETTDLYNFIKSPERYEHLLFPFVAFRAGIVKKEYAEKLGDNYSKL